MLCTNAINTSNTIRTQKPVPAERHSSGLDSNSCYYVLPIAFNYRSLYDMKKCYSDMSQRSHHHATHTSYTNVAVNLYVLCRTSSSAAWIAAFWLVAQVRAVKKWLADLGDAFRRQLPRHFCSDRTTDIYRHDKIHAANRFQHEKRPLSRLVHVARTLSRVEQFTCVK